jgi:prevent-host-death family protein
MPIHLTEDIRSVTDLKRRTREILHQLRQTGRPIVVTVNGKADAVLLDARTYEQYLRAANMARLIAEGEEDIAARRVRPMRAFLKEFGRARKVRR